MGKYTLNIYDEKTGEKAKTLTRSFMPTGLFLKYQKLSEDLVANKIESNSDLFKALEPLILDTFDELTSEDYASRVDVGEVFAVYKTVLKKALDASEKNA